MEKKLISMAREMEKLRAEVANVEHRTHAAAPVGNPGTTSQKVLQNILIMQSCS